MHLQPWMLLLVLLSAGSRLSAVDVDWLTDVVKAIRTEYNVKGQFCLAANIPENKDTHRLEEILKNNDVKASFEDAIMYENDKKNEIVAVKQMKGAMPHAEKNVLQKLPSLKGNHAGNFLLIYSYLSPCSHCVAWMKNSDFRNNVKAWEDAAFVFTTVYNKPGGGSKIQKKKLRSILRDLGESMGGLDRVYRCYGPKSELQCLSCSSDEEVCLENEPTSGQRGSNNGGMSPRGGDAGGRGSLYDQNRRSRRRDNNNKIQTSRDRRRSSSSSRKRNNVGGSKRSNRKSNKVSGSRRRSSSSSRRSSSSSSSSSRKSNKVSGSRRRSSSSSRRRSSSSSSSRKSNKVGGSRRKSGKSGRRRSKGRRG